MLFEKLILGKLLLKLLKKCLTFIAKDRPIYENALVIFLAEVVNTLNSCPLRRLSDDLNDLCILTPNHLFLGN